ncbi:MAG: S-layer homology domain-containing protein, partial [Propionibacteriaceae bacterium]|nr:S-layer homology domain-containing protein [Propionibacteriaceae bacterium]
SEPVSVTYAAAPICTGKLAITGSLRVGQPITATGLDCGDAEVKYAWNKALSPKTGVSVTPGTLDLGNRIQVVATATRGNDTETYTVTSERSVRFFVDVPSNHRFYDAINRYAYAGIISSGAANDNFFGDRAITRGELAAYLYRIAQRIGLAPNFQAPATPSFSDVPKTHTFYTEIEWLKAAGLTSVTTFNPGATASRGEVAAFLHRMYALGGSTAVSGTIPYLDVPNTHLFYASIKWMRLKGYAADGKYFYPDRATTREEFIAFADRIFPQSGWPVPGPVIVYNSAGG